MGYSPWAISCSFYESVCKRMDSDRLGHEPNLDNNQIKTMQKSRWKLGLAAVLLAVIGSLQVGGAIARWFYDEFGFDPWNDD